MNRDTYEMLNRLQSIGIDYNDANAIRRCAMTGKRWPTPDRETGAIKRLNAIMARYPKLSAYLQGDCRGAAVYILRPGDVPEGCNVNSYYSRGIAVFK